MPLRDAEIAEVDAFLAGAKTLIGPPPAWDQSSRASELTATWPIADALGIAVAHLRFRCGKSHRGYPSMSLIFGNRPVWRIDIEDPTTVKRNPVWAARLGLPALVVGTHGHEWPDNREHVRRIEAGPWELPARRPIQPQIRRLSQAVPWFAAQINLILSIEQRGFDVPPQSELF